MIEFHPLANIFPMMNTEEYTTLKDDIARHGLRDPITLIRGKIADGRNRYNACVELGIKPRYEERDGAGDLLAFIISRNLHRRHLNESQRAIVAARVANLEHGGDRRSDEFQAADLPLVSQCEAAQMLGVGERSIRSAKKVLTEGTPELIQAVERGNVAASLASKVAEMDEADQTVFINKVKAGEKPTKVLRCVQRQKQGRERECLQQAIESLSSKAPRLIVGRAEDMTEVENESVDLIVTSPPYNLGSGSWPMGGQGREPRENGIGYQDAIPEDEYQKWQIECLREMYRAAKPGASLFYNHKVRQKDGQMIHPLDWLRSPDNPWILRQEIIWDRGSTHNHCPVLFWPHDERIYWMTKGKPNLPEGKLVSLAEEAERSTIWRFHGPVANTWHPAPFPPDLPRKCIEAIGRADLVVLDPFAGSCTTLKVAMEEFGYDAIGLDSNPDYLKKAREENGWMIESES